MKSENLKHELHDYIDLADNKTLEAIHTLVKPSIEQMQLSKQQKQELNKRKKNHLSNRSQSYTWAETERMVKSRKK